MKKQKFFIQNNKVEQLNQYIDKNGVIDKSTFNKVQRMFFENLFQNMIFENFIYNIPNDMGTLSITKKKTKSYIDDTGKLRHNFPVDWGKTIKLWKENMEAKERKQLVYHENQHSDGFRYRFKWNKYENVYRGVRHLRFFKFIPNRLTAITPLSIALINNQIQIDHYER